MVQVLLSVQSLKFSALKACALMLSVAALSVVFAFGEPTDNYFENSSYSSSATELACSIDNLYSYNEMCDGSGGTIQVDVCADCGTTGPITLEYKHDGVAGWSGPVSSADGFDDYYFSNLEPGTYTEIVITDANNCTAAYFGNVTIQASSQSCGGPCGEITHTVTMDQWTLNGTSGTSSNICGSDYTSTTDAVYQNNNLDEAAFLDPIGNIGRTVTEFTITFNVAACDYQENTNGGNVNQITQSYPIELNGTVIGYFDPVELACIENVCQPENLRTISFPIDLNAMTYNFGGSNTVDFNFYTYSTAQGQLQHICFGDIILDIKSVEENPAEPCNENPGEDFSFDCEDGKRTDIYTLGIRDNIPATLNIPNSGNISNIVVEAVYKSSNPGPYIQFMDDNGTNYYAERTTPYGNSPNVWVYRAILPATASISYANETNKWDAQSLAAFVTRTNITGVQQSGLYTYISGYHSEQTFNLTLPAASEPRDIVVHMPMSEITLDGRVLLMEATAGLVNERWTEKWSAGELDPCCIDVITRTLEDVPGNVTNITFRLVSPEANEAQYSGWPGWNGENGQSYVVAGIVDAITDCSEDTGTTEFFNDCGTNRAIDVYVKGLKDPGNDCINIPQGDQITRIIAEAWVERGDCTNNTFPTTLTFSAGTTSQSASFVDVAQASSSGVPERIYRTVFTGSANSICVSDLMGCNVSSLALYVERMSDGGSSSLTLLDYELHDDATPAGLDDCVMTTLQIGESPLPKDVSIKIPIHEKDNSRQVEITITAKTASGSVVAVENASFTAQNAGDEAALYEMTFTNIAGTASQVVVEVCSPDPNGDSFGVGGVVSSTTGCEFCTPPNANNDNGLSDDCGDGTLTGNVLGNDTGYGNNQTLSITTQPTNGTVTIDNAGNFSYTATGNACTSDQFTYKLCKPLESGAECCDLATVLVTIGESTPPTLNNTPSNTTVNCEDQIPAPANVTASDNCGSSNVIIDFSEVRYEGTVTACANSNVTDPDRCNGSEALAVTLPFQGLTDNYSIVNATLTEFTDGTATITGEIQNVVTGNQRWLININLFGKTYDAPVNSPKLEATCANPDVSTFYYYVGMTGTFTGQGAFNGATLDVTRWGPAVQLGDGASNYTTGFGLATWFDVEVTSQPSGNTTLVPGVVGSSGTQNGDFNLVLSGNPNQCTPENPDCNFKVVRTWLATDGCSNEAVHTQTITVIDNIKPNFPNPQTLNIECDDNVPAVVLPIPTDNCSATNEINIELVSETNTQGTNPNNCNFYTYEIVRTFRATDACGNFRVKTQTINVNDTEAPTVSNCPTTTTVIGDLPIVIDPVFTDNCDNDLTLTYNQTTPNGCDYDVTRTWTATDACGNSTSCEQVISVNANLTCDASVTSNYNGYDVSEVNATDGQVTISASGGTLPYQYKNGNGAFQNSNVFNGLGAGTYTFTTRDTYGCETTCTVTIENPDFDLALIIELADGEDTRVYKGENVTFTITVENQGSITASNIEISNYIPNGFLLANDDWTFVTANLATIDLPGTLAPGQSTTVDITLMVMTTEAIQLINVAEISSATDPNGDNIGDIDSAPDNNPTNDAGGNVNSPADDFLNGDGTGNVPGTVAATDEDDADPEDVIVEIFDLALTKTLNSSTQQPIINGRNVTFDINVTNQGTAAATDINLIDYIPNGLVLNDAQWTANGAGTTATYNQPFGLSAGESTTIPVTFSINIGYEGMTQNFAEISSAKDDLGDSPVDIDSTPDTNNSNDTVVDNEINNGGGDQDDHDIEVIDVLRFDLALAKLFDIAATQMPIAQNRLVTFQIQVANQGEVNATNVELVDYIPAGLTLEDSNWTANVGGTQATYNSPLSLAVGQMQSISITFRVNTGVTGQIVNEAEISAADDENGAVAIDYDSVPDANPDNDNDVQPGSADDNETEEDGRNGGDEDDNDVEAINVETFDLALTKTLNLLTQTPIVTGRTVIFDINVVNQGTVDATDIELTDYVPAGLTLVPGNGWTMQGGNAVYNTLLDLNVGQNNTIQITFTVDGQVEGALENFAEISDARDEDGAPIDDIDSTPDQNNGNDTVVDNEINNAGGDQDDHDIEMINVDRFDLALTKLFNNAQSANPIVQNRLVTFDITVVNQGSIAATAIELTDYIPAELVLEDSDWTASADGLTATLNNNFNLAVGQNTVIPITFRVKPGITGDVVNRAEISGALDQNGAAVVDYDSTPDALVGNDNGGVPNGPSDNETDENGKTGGDEDDADPALITVETFDIALRKTLNVLTQTPIVTGRTVTFDIYVENQGTITATGIELTDYVPAGLTLVTGQGWTMVGGNAVYDTELSLVLVKTKQY